MLVGWLELACHVPRRPSSGTHWYWGETCELSDSKNMVYGSVGAMLVLLVVVIVVLTIFFSHS